MHAHRTSRRALAAAVLPMIVLTGCAAAEDAAPPGSATEGTTEADSREASSGATEVAAASPRLAITYDGGVLVLDGTTLEVLADEEIEGFARLNPAGDGRHFLVSAP
ncbi:MAG TPA: hypothetical protein PKB06_08560, partial [Actinotalea sp.]|nr:hypothetical protein [Actinotalea sp.]